MFRLLFGLSGTMIIPAANTPKAVTFIICIHCLTMLGQASDACVFRIYQKTGGVLQRATWSVVFCTDNNLSDQLCLAYTSPDVTEIQGRSIEYTTADHRQTPAWGYRQANEAIVSLFHSIWKRSSGGAGHVV